MPAVCAEFNLCVLGLWWNTEFGSDVADIPIAVTLVVIDQGAFNHIEFPNGRSCLRKELDCVALAGETKHKSLRVMCFYIEKRPDLWASEAT